MAARTVPLAGVRPGSPAVLPAAAAAPGQEHVLPAGMGAAGRVLYLGRLQHGAGTLSRCSALKGFEDPMDTIPQHLGCWTDTRGGDSGLCPLVLALVVGVWSSNSDRGYPIRWEIRFEPPRDPQMII